MPNIEVIQFTKDYVELSINSKVYRYSWGKDNYQLNKQMYESYWFTFGRNKGRFLNKLKPFLLKDETNV